VPNEPWKMKMVFGQQKIPYFNQNSMLYSKNIAVEKNGPIVTCSLIRFLNTFTYYISLCFRSTEVRLFLLVTIYRRITSYHYCLNISSYELFQFLYLFKKITRTFKWYRFTHYRQFLPHMMTYLHKLFIVFRIEMSTHTIN